MFFPTLQTNFHTFQSLLKSGSASQPQTDKSGPDGERVTRKERERERERGKNRPETQKRRQSANCLNSWLLLRVQQRCSLGGMEQKQQQQQQQTLFKNQQPGLMKFAFRRQRKGRFCGKYS
jgi:hypothetical protein